MSEKRLRQFRRAHCGSIPINETYLDRRQMALSVPSHRQAWRSGRFPADGEVRPRQADFSFW